MKAWEVYKKVCTEYKNMGYSGTVVEHLKAHIQYEMELNDNKLSRAVRLCELMGDIQKELRVISDEEWDAIVTAEKLRG